MMSKEDSVLWDNDPHSVPKTEESKLRVMHMVYDLWKHRGLKPDDPQAVDISKEYPITYAAWLATKANK